MTGEQPLEGDDGPEDPTVPPSLAAIDRIFRQRHDHLIRLARRLSKRLDFRSEAQGLDDVVQDTMVAICKIANEGKLPNLATDTDRMRYIHGVMRNQILLAKDRQGATRRGGGFQRVDVDLDLRPTPQAPEGSMADPSGELDQRIERIQDPMLREVASGLRDGRTCKEIAERLGVSERTVRRKRDLLRELFPRRRRGD